MNKNNDKYKMKLPLYSAVAFVLAAGCFVLAYMMYMLVASMDFGTAAVVVTGILLVCYGVVRIFSTLDMPFGKVMGIVCRVGEAAFAAWLLFFIVMQCLIGFGARSDAPEDTAPDYVVVFGARVYGSRVSNALKCRLDAAIPYCEKHIQSYVLLSGGQGEGESISEAEAMRKYMSTHNILTANYIKEERATDTRENVLFSTEIMNYRSGEGQYSVVAVSSDYHLYRIRRLFKKQGIDVTCIAADSPNWGVALSGRIRESFSIVNMWLEN